MLSSTTAGLDQLGDLVASHQRRALSFTATPLSPSALSVLRAQAQLPASTGRFVPPNLPSQHKSSDPVGSSSPSTGTPLAPVAQYAHVYNTGPSTVLTQSDCQSPTARIQELMSAMFTSEQLELIKRLRQTGCTVSMIQAAYAGLDQLDKQADTCQSPKFRDMLTRTISGIQLPTIPQSQVVLPSTITDSSPTVDVKADNNTIKPQFVVPLTTASGSHDISTLTILAQLAQRAKAQHSTPLPDLSSLPPRRQSFTAGSITPSFNFTPPRFPPTYNTDLIQAKLNNLPVPLREHSTLSPEASARLPNGFLPDAARSNGGGRMLSKPASSTSTATANQPKPDIQEFVTLHEPAELEELLKNGEEAAISQLKLFIQQYQLRQTTVGSMTGISQPYVSKFLNGNYRELSLRCRTKIFVWYLNCRKNPDKMARFIADPYGQNKSPTAGDDSGDSATRVRAQSLSEAALLSRQLKPSVLRILEENYAENPCPDLQKRINIASECNRALNDEHRTSGAAMTAREVINHAIVAAWFNNRRKQALAKDDIGTSEKMHPDDASSGRGTFSMDAGSSLLGSSLASIASNDSAIHPAAAPDDNCQSMPKISITDTNHPSQMQLSQAQLAALTEFSIRSRRAYSESLNRQTALNLLKLAHERINNGDSQLPSSVIITEGQKRRVDDGRSSNGSSDNQDNGHCLSQDDDDEGPHQRKRSATLNDVKPHLTPISQLNGEHCDDSDNDECQLRIDEEPVAEVEMADAARVANDATPPAFCCSAEPALTPQQTAMET